MSNVIRCYFVSFLKKRAAEFQQSVRAHWINYFDAFPHCKRGIISGSTEIVPGALGGVTFQEIAIVCLQPDFLNTFS